MSKLDQTQPTVIPGQQSLTDDVVKQPESGQQVLFEMEGLMKNHVEVIGKLNVEIKNHKEMLEDILANDPTYQEHLKAAKEATKVKNATKKQVLKQPQAAQLDAKLKDMKVELKENKAALSDYAVEYYKLSQSDQVEAGNGEVLDIKMEAKVSIKKAFR